MLCFLRFVWFLLVSVVVLVKDAVNIYQVVGDEVKRCHVLVLSGFAVAIHFRDVLLHRKVAHR